MEPSGEREPGGSPLSSCPPSLPQPQPDAPFSWLRLFSQLLQRVLPGPPASLLLLKAEAGASDPEPSLPVWGAAAAAELAPLLVQHHLGLVSSSFVLGGADQDPLPAPLSAPWEQLPDAHRICSKLPEILRQVQLRASKAGLDVPDPDYGYHSLEGEQQRGSCALKEPAGSSGDHCEPEREGPDAGNTRETPAARDPCDEAGTAAESIPDEDFDLDRESLPVESRPACANKLIDYIMGGACSGEESEEEEEEQGWDGDEENDDGFDSEGSLSGSETASQEEESTHLWNSFCSLDPYNLQNFTAVIQTAGSEAKKELPGEPNGEEDVVDSSPWTESSGEEDDWDSSGLDESENLKLWNSFCNLEDPYNPFNFKAQFQTAEKKVKHSSKGLSGTCLGLSQQSVYLSCQVHVLDNCEPEIKETVKHGILSREKCIKKKKKKVWEVFICIALCVRYVLNMCVLYLYLPLKAAYNKSKQVLVCSW